MCMKFCDFSKELYIERISKSVFTIAIFHIQIANYIYKIDKQQGPTA